MVVAKLHLRGLPLLSVLEALAVSNSTKKQTKYTKNYYGADSTSLECEANLFATLGFDLKRTQDPLLGEYVNEKLFEKQFYILQSQLS